VEGGCVRGEEGRMKDTKYPLINILEVITQHPTWFCVRFDLCFGKK